MWRPGVQGERLSSPKLMWRLKIINFLCHVNRMEICKTVTCYDGMIDLSILINCTCVMKLVCYLIQLIARSELHCLS